eukprot:scaffold4990_cov387-Prasinococcus_capsulatus_cf.AAC.37
MCAKPCASPFTQFPSTLRDVLMLWASLRVLPVAPDFFTLSDPARSTRRSFALYPVGGSTDVATRTVRIRICAGRGDE